MIHNYIKEELLSKLKKMSYDTHKALWDKAIDSCIVIIEYGSDFDVITEDINRLRRPPYPHWKDPKYNDSYHNLALDRVILMIRKKSRKAVTSK